MRGRRCGCPRERSEQPASVMAAKRQSTFSVLTCLCAPVFPHLLASHICPAPTNPKLSVSNTELIEGPDSCLNMQSVTTET